MRDDQQQPTSQAPGPSALRYTIVAFDAGAEAAEGRRPGDRTLYRIERSDGQQLIELRWGCCYDVPDPQPDRGPMVFYTRNDAERIVSLCMAGVPLEYLPIPPAFTGTNAWEWAAE